MRMKMMAKEEEVSLKVFRELYLAPVLTEI